MGMVVYKNQGLKENWFALYLCVKKNYTSDTALNRLGILRLVERKPLTEVNIEEITTMYNSGMTVQAIADELQASSSSIRVKLVNSGVTMRRRGALNKVVLN